MAEKAVKSYEARYYTIKYKLSDVIVGAKSTTQYTKHSNYSSIVP